LGWGCGVVTADTDGAAITGIADCGHVPDLIISDSLTNGKLVSTSSRDCAAFDTPIPAFSRARHQSRAAAGSARHRFHLLHKPVDPMTLRAMVNRMLKNDAARVRL
jgi:hypothetical protein